MVSRRLLFLLSLSLAQAQGDNKTPTLDPDVIQSGSFTDGTGAVGADAAQAASLTAENNFINFCKGQTLTNGLQITEGSCNGIVMGQIPSVDQMISVVITNPQNGDSIESGEDFDITVQVSNLEAGAFTNPAATYYAAPQQLERGIVIGHLHITVQDTGSSLNPTEPLDPTKFAFFKGINDAGDGRGKLSAPVAGGLPAGNYRLCTLTSAANHQPVIMPVAQRGSQDDCVRFTVTGNAETGNQAASDGKDGQAEAALTAEAVALGPGAPGPGNNNGGNDNDGGDGGNNDGNGNNNNGGGNNRGGDGNKSNDNNRGNGGNRGKGNNRGGGRGGDRKGGNNNTNDDGGGDNTGDDGENRGEEEDEQTSSVTATASETFSPTQASIAAPTETPQAGQQRRGRTDRLGHLSRRRRFIT